MTSNDTIMNSVQLTDDEYKDLVKRSHRGYICLFDLGAFIVLPIAFAAVFIVSDLMRCQ